MATLTKCPKCRRTTLVFGKPYRTTVVWICPRCKRGETCLVTRAFESDGTRSRR